MHLSKEKRLLAATAYHMQSMGCRCIATSTQGNTWNGEKTCETFRCANVDRPVILRIMSFLGDGNIDVGAKIVCDAMRPESNDNKNEQSLREILRSGL